MTLPQFHPQAPRTAAELLDGLLHSSLFAESIFGQILDQSSAYLGRQAEEFAAALVQKKVLTEWQAGELLAGRIGLYAGTYRLLERLATGSQTELLIAEQPGLQRLVLLQVTRGNGQSPSNESIGSPQERSLPSPIVRWIGQQSSAGLRLTVFEFVEATTLTALLAVPTLERKHRADLLLQIVRTTSVLNIEAIEALCIEAMLVNAQGELKILAEPAAMVVESPATPGAEAYRVAVAIRFAATLAILPEIESCQTTTAMARRLSEIAEPWSEANAGELIRTPRSRMNRYLRRGPGLRVIEGLGADCQFVLPEIVAEDATSSQVEASINDSTAIEDLPPIAEAESLVDHTSPKRNDTGGVNQKPRRSRKQIAGLLLLLGGIAAGFAATQWNVRWGILRAKAASESPTPPAPPANDKSLTSPSPEPSRRGHSPLPQ